MCNLASRVRRFNKAEHTGKKKKNLVTALLSHASSRHNEISLRLSEPLSSDWHEITLAKRQLRLVYFLIRYRYLFKVMDDCQRAPINLH